MNQFHCSDGSDASPRTKTSEVLQASGKETDLPANATTPGGTHEDGHEREGKLKGEQEGECELGFPLGALFAPEENSSEANRTT